MPGSVRENDEDIRSFVQEAGIKTALDVGPGRGTYSRILDGLGLRMTAVEVWKPYIRKYQLREKYNGGVTNQDVRKHQDFDYDLIIFGDVLEHMTREDALSVWERASKQARYGMISIPIIHYPQGALKGNPYEVHVQEHLHPEDVRRDYGPFVRDWCYDITGTFVKKFTE